MNNLNEGYYTYDDDGKYVHVLPLDDCINSLQQRIIDQDRIINKQKAIIKESQPFVYIMNIANEICQNEERCETCPFLKQDSENGEKLTRHYCSYDSLLLEHPEEFQRIILDWNKNRE